MSKAHEAAWPLLSAYLDEELDQARRRLVAEHLATCVLCTQELAQLQGANKTLAGLEPTPLAPDLLPQLRRRLRRRGTPVALAGGLTAVLVLLLRSAVHDLAILKRKELPLWGRLGIAVSNMLLIVPGIALCLELLRDVRTLVEYAWLSNKTPDAGA